MKNRDTRSDLRAVQEDYPIRDGIDAGDASVGKGLESAKYQALLDIHLMKSEKARHSVPPNSASLS
jgi:hypothetical protein